VKIALIGDVHANLPALEAVLAHAHSQGAEQIWNCGDFVGYGAYPSEVVQRLRDIGALSIAGNYDRKVLQFPQKQAKWQKSKRPEKWLAFGWAYERLSPEARAYLAALPDERLLEVQGRRFLLTHGSPESNEEHLTPETPSERLRQLVRRAAEQHGGRLDAVICGHSHRQFTRMVTDTWFINTGSVGRPDDGDPRAAYALLELGRAGLQTIHYRLAYDLEQAVAAIRANGLPEAFAQMLLRGRDLEAVADSQNGNG
jgi:putative phosphoesterase